MTSRDLCCGHDALLAARLPDLRLAAHLRPFAAPVLLLLALLALVLPVLAQSPQIRFEAGADVLSLDRNAIASAEIPEGYPAVISGTQDLVPLLIRFVPEVGQAIEQLTARHIGETIAIRIDGALVSQPVIREAVTTGGIIITNMDRRIAEAVLAAAGAGAGPGQ